MKRVAMLLMVLLMVAIGCRSVNGNSLVKVVEQGNCKMSLYQQGDFYTLIYELDGVYEGYSTWRVDHEPMNSFGVMVYNQLSNKFISNKPRLANAILYH